MNPKARVAYTIVIALITLCVCASAHAQGVDPAPVVEQTSSSASVFVSALFGAGGLTALVAAWWKGQNDKDKTEKEFQLSAEKQFMDAATTLQVKYCTEFQRLEEGQRRLEAEITGLKIKIDELSEEKTALEIKASRLEFALIDVAVLLTNMKIPHPSSLISCLHAYSTKTTEEN